MQLSSNARSLACYNFDLCGKGRHVADAGGDGGWCLDCWDANCGPHEDGEAYYGLLLDIANAKEGA